MASAVRVRRHVRGHRQPGRAVKASSKRTLRRPRAERLGDRFTSRAPRRGQGPLAERVRRPPGCPRRGAAGRYGDTGILLAVAERGRWRRARSTRSTRPRQGRRAELAGLSRRPSRAAGAGPSPSSPSAAQVFDGLPGDSWLALGTRQRGRPSDSRSSGCSPAPPERLQTRHVVARRACSRRSCARLTADEHLLSWMGPAGVFAAGNGLLTSGPAS